MNKEVTKVAAATKFSSLLHFHSIFVFLTYYVRAKKKWQMFVVCMYEWMKEWMNIYTLGFMTLAKKTENLMSRKLNEICVRMILLRGFVFSQHGGSLI